MNKILEIVFGPLTLLDRFFGWDEERCAICDYPITTLLDAYSIDPYIVHALCWHIDEGRWWEGELDRIYDRNE